MEEENPDQLLVDHLQLAWKHAVRALNVCQSSGKTDTAKHLCEIIACLSQDLEFHQSMNELS